MQINVILVVDTTSMKPASLNQNIIFLCAEFAHSFSIKLAVEFKRNELDITAEQFSILVVLWYQDGISQKKIGEQLNRDKTTITRVLSNMKKSRLIRQVTDSNDNRSNLIFLTAKGKDIQKRGVRISGNLYQQVLQGLSAKQLQTGIGVMDSMLKQIEGIA